MMHDSPRVPFLRSLGQRVRALRSRSGLTRRELAARSGLSERFLGGIESGSGNVSLVRFCELARALGVAPDELLRDAARGARRHIALLGLRGAGKSTIGRALAQRLGIPFVELDQLIEEDLGMPLAQVFELHGERYFRQHERETLRHHVDRVPASVIATGGGIVTDPQTIALLRESCATVWLRATAEDHWNRVVAQGDRRPMAGNPGAMGELRELLLEREPLYAQAENVLDTSRGSPAEAVARLAERYVRGAAD
jgi:XRE family aerobic/anaerobic benzoate catabolism transcriptional regulator